VHALKQTQHIVACCGMIISPGRAGREEIDDDPADSPEDAWARLEQKLLSDVDAQPSPLRAPAVLRQHERSVSDTAQDELDGERGSVGSVKDSSMPTVRHLFLAARYGLDLQHLTGSSEAPQVLLRTACEHHVPCCRWTVASGSHFAQYWSTSHSEHESCLQQEGVIRQTSRLRAASGPTVGSWGSGKLAQKGVLMASNYDVAAELEALLEAVEEDAEPQHVPSISIQAAPGAMAGADDLVVDDIDDLDLELAAGGQKLNTELEAQLAAFDAQYTSDSEDEE
jgi:hypothetical protein